MGLFKPRSQWYPVTKATKCASGFVGFSQEESEVATAPEELPEALSEETAEVTSDATSETRRRLLWKRLLRAGKQVLQISLQAQEPVVPCHQGDQVRKWVLLTSCT